MRWSKGERSENLEDRRAQGASGGGGGGFKLPGGKLSLGGIIVAIIAAVIVPRLTGQGGGNAADVLGNMLGGGQQQGGTPSGGAPAGPDPDAELVEFMNFCLKDLEVVWQERFAKRGERYREPNLVLFRDAVQTGCGAADSGIGPFYCPADEKVYIDLSFYRELDRRFGAPGDFAQAYVLAHEIGHHVQALLGYTARVERETRANPKKQNDLSIRLELQADCLAGVWGNYGAKKQLLEPGDLEEGLAAASAVGDDTLQKAATGRVSPESWTHGSSAQRMAWFKKGFAAGDEAACDTFSVATP